MPITPAAIRALAEGNMDNFLAAATPGGIEAQEAMPEFDEAGKSHMRDKAASVPVEHQAYGHMSDEWVADRVRMLRHRDLDHEAICCAARDRIMRLSLRVALFDAIEFEARHLLRGIGTHHALAKAGYFKALEAALAKLTAFDGGSEHGK